MREQRHTAAQACIREGHTKRQAAYKLTKLLHDKCIKKPNESMKFQEMKSGNIIVNINGILD